MVCDVMITPSIPLSEGGNSSSGNFITFTIDLLRATTTLTNAFHNGLNSAIVLANYDEAIKEYSKLNSTSNATSKPHQIVLGGEVNNLKAPNFNFGNSPLEYSKENIEGKKLVFTSSNGAKAINLNNESKSRFVLSYLNLQANIEYLLEISKEDDNILLICSGSNGKVSLEDMYLAGAMIFELGKVKPIKLSDNSKLALSLFTANFLIEKDFILGLEHSRKLIKQGFEEDIFFSLKKDYTDTLIKIENNILSKIS
jgi:2-phosphosulfolactate phosphatase